MNSAEIILEQADQLLAYESIIKDLLAVIEELRMNQYVKNDN